jgi:hypothetical protein
LFNCVLFIQRFLFLFVSSQQEEEEGGEIEPDNEQLLTKTPFMESNNEEHPGGAGARGAGDVGVLPQRQIGVDGGMAGVLRGVQNALKRNAGDAFGGTLPRAGGMREALAHGIENMGQPATKRGRIQQLNGAMNQTDDNNIMNGAPLLAPQRAPISRGAGKPGARGEVVARSIFPWKTTTGPEVKVLNINDGANKLQGPLNGPKTTKIFLSSSFYRGGRNSLSVTAADLKMGEFSDGLPVFLRVDKEFSPIPNQEKEARGLRTIARMLKHYDPNEGKVVGRPELIMTRYPSIGLLYDLSQTQDPHSQIALLILQTLYSGEMIIPDITRKHHNLAGTDGRIVGICFRLRTEGLENVEEEAQNRGEHLPSMYGWPTCDLSPQQIELARKTPRTYRYFRPEVVVIERGMKDLPLHKRSGPGWISDTLILGQIGVMEQTTSLVHSKLEGSKQYDPLVDAILGNVDSTVMERQQAMFALGTLRIMAKR